MRRTKKPMLILMMLASILLKTNAQVTIGSGETPDNNALLDLKESETISTKGLLMPRVALTSTTSYAPMTGHIMGMTIFNTATVGDVTPGFYYNDGSKWVRLLGIDSVSSTWHVSETDQASISNQDNIYHAGQVGIGKEQTVDPTAILNVSASDKGVLFPRIALSSSTDIVTIPNPSKGLLVYNTGAKSTFTTVGYMFWNGSQWMLFNSTSSESGRATLNCSNATMSPNQQIKGNTSIIAGTILQVPYTASNGGSFNGATLVSEGNPNVTATISPGILSVGNGVISFSLSGTPTSNQQPPNGIVFDITPFLEANPDITGCDKIVVGNILEAIINETAVMGYLTHGTDIDGVTGYSLECKAPDGKYSVRVFVPTDRTSISLSNDQRINIQVRNNQETAQTVIWNYSTIWTSGLWSGANMFTMAAQQWGGDNDSGTTWHPAQSNSTPSYGGYWGNSGIYDGYGPEYRRYTWIPLGPTNNVSYEIYVMAALDTPTPTVAVSPTLMKVYIRFVQVTAAQ